MNDEDSDFIDLEFSPISKEKMAENAFDFFQLMNKRRTTRHFSTKHVPRNLIEMAIKTAGTAHLELIYNLGLSLRYQMKI